MRSGFTPKKLFLFYLIALSPANRNDYLRTVTHNYAERYVERFTVTPCGEQGVATLRTTYRHASFFFFFFFVRLTQISTPVSCTKAAVLRRSSAEDGDTGPLARLKPRYHASTLS